MHQAGDGSDPGRSWAHCHMGTGYRTRSGLNVRHHGTASGVCPCGAPGDQLDRPAGHYRGGHAVARTRAFLAGAALEQKKLPPARTAPCALRGPDAVGEQADPHRRLDPCTSVGAGRRAAHPPLRRLRHAAATACDQRAWVVTRPRRDRPPARANCRRHRRFGPPAGCRGRSGRRAVERVGYPHRAGRDGDAGGATADLDWQAGVAKGAMLDVRCWMGYCWSKKVRTSALKRAGCSMFEA